MVRNNDLSRFQGLLARMNLNRLLAGFALALMLLGPYHLFAQTTGSLTGVVKDSTGAIVPGAKVTLVNSDDKSVRSDVSSGAAFFSFAAVQPGTYNLNVTAKGFETFVITGIEMHPGDSKNIENITLKIGRVEQSFTVTSSVAGVELDSPEKSYLITEEDIKRLSTVGRDATELVRILPGFAVASADPVRASTTIPPTTAARSLDSPAARSAALRPMALLPARAQSRSSPTAPAQPTQPTTPVRLVT